MTAVRNSEHSLHNAITVRCYAELNDFLAMERRQKDFTLKLKMPVTVAEVIELLSIPLSEVDLVLVNSLPVSRFHRLHGNDQMSVYPEFEILDVSSLRTTQKQPLRHTRFILDAHLGKLAKYLRMLGFDTLYRNDFGDDEIIQIAGEQKRIILSRDKLLLKDPAVDHGYYVRSTEKHDQLIEVVRKFDLYSQFRSFTRCMTCNAVLQPKNKTFVRHLVEPDTLRTFDDFFYCPDCRKVFWKGSHFERMERLILQIVEARAR
ncbi:MAG: Mut7-C RNAse domain-containing protein [Bacteroidales bacterium]